VRLEKSFEDNERVDGVIFGRVKGGFTVDLAALLRSCRARRWTSAQCATSPR
jgi:ribosomal protein S1